MGQKAIEGVEGLNRAGEISELGRFSRSRQLMWGHSLYLIWWCIFFRPNAQVKGGALRIFGIACILVAAVAGHRRRSVRMFWYQYVTLARGRFPL